MAQTVSSKTFPGSNDKTYKHIDVAPAAGSAVDLVAAVSGKSIVVHSMHVIGGSGDGTFTLLDGASTFLTSSAIPFSATRQWNLDFTEQGHFATTAGNALKVNSVTVTLEGFLVYSEQ